MTKETKIGLLVGLAFIVLFAIILSEKGTSNREGRIPQFTLADSAKNSTNLGTAQPLGDKGRLPVDNQLAPIIKPTNQPAAPALSPPKFEEEQVAQTTLEEEPLPALPTELVNSLNLASIPDNPKPATTPFTGLAMGPQRELDKPAALQGPVLSTPIVPATVDSKPKALAMADTTKTAVKTEPTKEEIERIKETSGIKYKTTHEVQKGESLGKIAAKYYGRSTPARVDAIFNANRDVLKTPAAVKATQKLKIPDLGEGFEEAPDFVLSSSNKNVTPIHASSEQSTPRIPIPVAEKPKTETKLAMATPEKQPTIKDINEEPAIKTALAKTTTEKSGRKATTEKPVESKPAPNSTKFALRPVNELPAEKSAEHLSKKATPAEKKKSDDPTAFVWYEVKKTDTLSKIARKELGSERETKSLYKINQDIINNQNTIKPGMKIRVPAKVKGTTEAPSAITSRSLDVTDD